MRADLFRLLQKVVLKDRRGHDRLHVQIHRTAQRAFIANLLWAKHPSYRGVHIFGVALSQHRRARISAGNNDQRDSQRRCHHSVKVTIAGAFDERGAIGKRLRSNNLCHLRRLLRKAHHSDPRFCSQVGHINLVETQTKHAQKRRTGFRHN